MVSEGGGIRVWYDDYTTIGKINFYYNFISIIKIYTLSLIFILDWIHDYVKERVRVRKLHSIKGIRGWVIKSCDGLQGWVLVFLIGKL